ncbi:MAG TPA: hypothetical protein VFS25_22885 [Chitinophaga sp.]|uniref:hypothetical protein n=1 Tax=Chitinophaga sp. TaxID=1869181 RepID=UPI002DBA2595|nr:hypothetical protein [Chitinophaga sp.]HEU4555710.1 hypothetical protein [Chitinophaga sp.]
MKKIVLALLVLITAQQAWAQHAHIESIFGNKSEEKKKITVGGYGTAIGKLTPVNGKLGVLTGLQGGVLLNHKLMLGAGGYGLTNSIKAPKLNVPDEQNQYIQMWYTGLMAEYIFNSDKLIHWSAGALLGGGGVGRDERHHGWHDDDDDHHGWYGSSGFFVAEPFVGVEVNITSYLRLNVGGSYRFIHGSNTPGLTDSDLSGGAFHVGIKAGKF